MKTTILALLTLTATTLASPTNIKRTGGGGGGGCGKPASYRCSKDLATIEVCDWDGKWKPLDPGCPKGHQCEPDPFGSGIPYCMLKAPEPDPDTNPNPGGRCWRPGKYTCTPDYKSIQICDVSNQLQLVGACPNFCKYISGIPYCF